MAKRVKFEVTGKDITNIKLGNIVNYETYCKDSINEDNTWRKLSSYRENEDWEVVQITPIDEKYTKLKLQLTHPVEGSNRSGKRKTYYYPKTRIVFDKNGVSKPMYSDSARGWSVKEVITNIKVS